jgi:hypothetical protein
LQSRRAGWRRSLRRRRRPLSSDGGLPIHTRSLFRFIVDLHSLCIYNRARVFNIQSAQ